MKNELKSYDQLRRKYQKTTNPSTLMKKSCNATNDAMTRITKSKDAVAHVKNAAPMALFAAPAAAGDSPTKQAASDLVKSFATADGLKIQADTVTDMAARIKPVLENYDEVLKLPYLDQFRANLEAAPMMCYKDGNICYLKTALASDNTSISYDWAVFSALPAGAPSVTPQTSLQVFPFQGQLYLSIGKMLWVKKVRSKDDPVAQAAVNDFPKIYYDQWEVASNLPSDNYKCIVPYATMKSGDAGNVIARLFMLDGDGKIKMLTTDSVPAQQTWVEMTAKGTLPAWKSIAFFNADVYALSQDGKLFKLTMNVDTKTFTFAEDVGVMPENITEMSGNDRGIVVVSNGILKNRLIDANTSKEDNIKYTWQDLGALNGGSRLGVASPGIILDMRIVTQYLKDRYCQTQVALYGTMESLNAFSVTHKVYLQKLLDLKDKDEETITKTGTQYIKQCQLWTKIIGGKIRTGKSAVNLMSKQMFSVTDQMHIQLKALDDNITALQAKLESEKETLKALEAAIWGSIAAVLVGIAVLIIGVATGMAWVGFIGGALIIGGIVACGVLADKAGDQQALISQTTSQIKALTKSKEQLTKIVGLFDNISDSYAALNEFWGRQANNISMVKDMDTATAMMIGEALLDETSSIEAAIQVLDQIKEGCTVYLDVLNSQGIHVDESDEDSAPTPMLLKSALKSGSPAPTCSSVKKDKVLDSPAVCLLQAGNFDSYTSTLAASALTAEPTSTWFNMPELKQASMAYSTNGSSVVKAAGISLVQVSPQFQAADASMSDKFEATKPALVASLQNVLSFSTTMTELKSKFPVWPANGEPTPDLTALVDKAISECSSARSSLLDAKNSFGLFQQSAINYSNQVEASIQQQKNDISARTAKFNSDKSHISCPWYVGLGGPAAVLAYMNSERSKIENDFKRDISSLNGTLDVLNKMLASQTVVNGNQLSWVNLVECLGRNVGDVYNDLLILKTSMQLDAKFYEGLINQTWDQVCLNCQETLAILNPPTFLRGALLKTSVSLKSSVSLPLKSSKNVQQLISSPNNLDQSLNSLTKNAEQVFQNLQSLSQMPSLVDLVGYWRDGSEKISMYQVIQSLKTDYVTLCSTSYPSMLNMNSFALQQQIRVQKLGNKSLSVDTYIKYSSYRLNAYCQEARLLTAKYKDSQELFEKVLENINANIKIIDEKLKQVDENIDKAEEEKRNTILMLVADICTFVIATAALCAAFGAFGPLAAPVALSAKLGLGASATAGLIKGVLDALKLSDLVALISQLKSTQKELQEGSKRLADVQGLFTDVTNGIDLMADCWTCVATNMQNLREDQDVIAQLNTLSASDADAAAKDWAEVADACQKWLDVINAQGIDVPTTQ